MTHEDLILSIEKVINSYKIAEMETLVSWQAIRAVVDLHRPVAIPNSDIVSKCSECSHSQYDEVVYPCPTIQAIEKELAQ